MSDYTHKNFLDDVDNSAKDRLPGGEIETRFGRSQLDTAHLGVSHFRLAPGFRPPFGHRHKVQEEVYVVVAGSGRFKLDDEIREVKQWDVIRVAPTVARAYEAGPDGLDLIIAGNDRPEEGDGEIVNDFWPAD